MVSHAAHAGFAVTGNSWPYLFKAFFVDDNNHHADDLLFFVANLEHVAQRDPAGLLQVYRRGSETRPMPPITGKEYDWEESTCLNLLMQQVNNGNTSWCSQALLLRVPTCLAPVRRRYKAPCAVGMACSPNPPSVRMCATANCRPIGHLRADCGDL